MNVILQSYMESHLKNKGRLQREWEALQRYEAEPNSYSTAIQPQCEPLNRVTAPLPYDHSRVVINHLANAEGLDYVRHLRFLICFSEFICVTKYEF